MFIDTLMALWNIICRGRIRKMVATSIGISVGLICLLAFIGLPAFSRSSDMIPNITTSSEADQNNDVILTSPHTRSEVTPPGVPPIAPPTPLPTLISDQANQRIPGPPQFTLPVPPPPPLPPAFIYPQPRIHHIHITIHRVPMQNYPLPPTPPADLTPPSFPPVMPTATAEPTTTSTPQSTPQATPTDVPVAPAPTAESVTPCPSPLTTATSVPVPSGPTPSITTTPASSSSIFAIWRED